MILIKPHSRLCISPFIHSSVVSTRSGVRSLDRTYTSICPTKFAELATNPAIKRQIYISRSTDPFLNLSIEHFLLQKTPAESTILFLYTNRPCVVIGRNQNPWVEVNLQLLDATQSQAKQGRGSSSIGDVLLVRRRSGGGTVFHDEGNVNYSVICPTPDFNRDKHAEMVVRALRDLGIARARVNDRHDIVLDQGPRLHDDRQPDAHRTAYMTDVIKDSKPLKISGSAYKLTRLRSLHHGTCLLSSPYLNIIPHYLHSPAKPYIKARGVDSVSSPIGNVGVGNVDFERSVIDQFATMYGLENNLHSAAMMSAAFQLGAGWVAGVVGNAHSEVPDICKGLLELRSSEWKYTQTPQFTFSSHAVEEDQRIKPDLPTDVLASTRVFLKVRSGNIAETRISLSGNDAVAGKEADNLNQLLSNRKLHEISDWNGILKQSELLHGVSGVSALARWLDALIRRAS